MNRIKHFLNTTAGRATKHAVITFAATFAVTAYGNRDHLLAAHGLDGLKAAGYAVAAAAAVAGWHAVEPQLATLAAKLVGRAITAKK